MTVQRNHPVRQLLDAAALGQIPSEPELDALRLAPDKRRKVADAAVNAAAAKAVGENREATRLARDSADQIVAGLPPELRNPDYLRPADTEPDDPESLAAQVSRW